VASTLERTPNTRGRSCNVREGGVCAGLRASARTADPRPFGRSQCSVCLPALRVWQQHPRDARARTRGGFRLSLESDSRLRCPPLMPLVLWASMWRLVKMHAGLVALRARERDAAGNERVAHWLLIVGFICAAPCFATRRRYQRRTDSSRCGCSHAREQLAPPGSGSQKVQERDVFFGK
jgi:hypothetical protein